MKDRLAKDGDSSSRKVASPSKPLEQNTHRCASTESRVMPLPNSPTRYRSNNKTALDEKAPNSEGVYMQELRREFSEQGVDDRVGPQSRPAGEDMSSENVPSYTSRSFYRTRPLLDLVKGEWRTNPKYGQTQSPSPDRSYRSRWVRAVRVQRYLLVYLLLVGACWLSWKWYLEPQWEEHLLLGGSLDERMKTGKGWFGSNKSLVFTDMVQLKTLDRRLVPGSGSRRTGKRLISVGDVHGCKDECTFPKGMRYTLYIYFCLANLRFQVISLLDKIHFHPRNDHLIFAGDMISKGPHSPAVVDFGHDIGASCVRGNHEDRVLLAYRDIHSKQLRLQGPDEDPQWGDDDMAEESFSHGDYRDRALARQLTTRQVDWLKKCPVILKVGELGRMGEVFVVHAGLVPGVEPENQDPAAVMNMRTIDLDTHVPSERVDGIRWTKVRTLTLIPRTTPRSERSLCTR